MKSIKLITFLLAFSVVTFSCKKKHEMSQEERERTETLQANELIENEHFGLRFFIVYKSGDADIALRMYQGSREIPLLVTEPFKNYHIETDSLARNTDFIIELDFKRVGASGSFDFMCEGYTAIRGGKTYELKGNTFTTSNAGTKKQFILLSKGIVKYTFIPR